MTRYALLLMLVVVPAVCADDADEIRKVLTDQVIAWNRNDLNGFMKGYWKSKDLTFISGKETTRGWDETLERYKNRYKAEGKEMGRLQFSDVDVRILATGVALVTGKWELKLSMETTGGRYTLILRKFDEEWRIVHDHTSG